MLKKLLMADAAGGNGNAKPSEADVLAELGGMKAALGKVNLSLPDLISQHASLTADKGTLTGEVAKLKGDATKLVAGATMPTDLVSAANTIATLTKERDDLKAGQSTLAVEVAKEVAKLGIVGGGKKDAAKTEPGKKLTLTEKVLAAKGVKTLEELNAKCEAERAGTAAAE